MCSKVSRNGTKNEFTDPQASHLYNVEVYGVNKKIGNELHALEMDTMRSWIEWMKEVEYQDYNAFWTQV